MKKLRFWFVMLLAVAMLMSMVACADEDVATGDEAPVSDGAAADDAVDLAVQPEQTITEPELQPTEITVVLSVPLGTDTLYGRAEAEYRMVMDCIYLRGMYRMNGALISDVLSSWEQTGAYSWRLKLYEGITDSNGDAFTAEDMVYCLQSESDNIASIVAADELTVELAFAVTDHNALEMLLSNTYLVTNEARKASEVLPAGFGRYVVDEFDGEGGLRLVRREDYRQQNDDRFTPIAAARSQIINFVYEENIILRASYAAKGEADLVCGLDEYHAGLIESGYNMRHIVGNKTVALFFNMDEERLMVEKPDLRSAVACAIDRGAIVASGEIADGLLPSDTIGYTPYGYAAQDIEMAEGYVKSARYRGQTLTLICAQEHAATAEMIAQQCAAIEIEVEVQVVDGDVKTTAASADWDMAIAGIEVISDAASSYAACFAAGENGATWFNFGRGDVLYVASVIATTAGHNSANIEMLETWLASNPVVLGLYTPGTISLIAESAGEPVVGDIGIIPGSLLPKENED